eukprot:scaffold68063_cov26-Prasinocladus_malaysianus.AAC.1
MAKVAWEWDTQQGQQHSAPPQPTAAAVPINHSDRAPMELSDSLVRTRQPANRESDHSSVSLSRQDQHDGIQAAGPPSANMRDCGPAIINGAQPSIRPWHHREQHRAAQPPVSVSAAATSSTRKKLSLTQSQAGPATRPEAPGVAQTPGMSTARVSILMYVFFPALTQTAGTSHGNHQFQQRQRSGPITITDSDSDVDLDAMAISPVLRNVSCLKSPSGSQIFTATEMEVEPDENTGSSESQGVLSSRRLETPQNPQPKKVWLAFAHFAPCFLGISFRMSWLTSNCRACLPIGFLLATQSEVKGRCVLQAALADARLSTSGGGCHRDQETMQRLTAPLRMPQGENGIGAASQAVAGKKSRSARCQLIDLILYPSMYTSAADVVY